MNEWYSKFFNWLTNASIGAAMAENPSVMTASGWRQAKDGKWKQDKVNDPGVKQLRSNLADLSMMSPTNPITAALDKIITDRLRYAAKYAFGIPAIGFGLKQQNK